jgi:hypothetical protein
MMIAASGANRSTTAKTAAVVTFTLVLGATWIGKTPAIPIIERKAAARINFGGEVIGLYTISKADRAKAAAVKTTI